MGRAPAPGASKTDRDAPKAGQDGLHTSQDNGPQNAPKRPEGASKGPKDASRTSPRPPWTLQKLLLSLCSVCKWCFVDSYENVPKHAPRRHQDRPSGPRTAPGRPKTPAPGGYRTTPKRIKNAPSSPRLPRARAPGLGSASPSLPDLGRFLAYMGQPGKWRTIGPMTMNMDEPKMGSNPPDELHIVGGIRVPSGPNWMICGVGHGWGKITNCQNRSH